MQHIKYDCNRQPRFSCPYCVKRSKWPFSLYKHIRKSHAGCKVLWEMIHYTTLTLRRCDAETEDFIGFEFKELLNSMKNLQRWDVTMSQYIGTMKEKPDVFLKKSHRRILCMKCSKEFVLMNQLWKHLKYQCGKSKRYKCPYCNRHSVWESTINRHIRNSHPGKQVFSLDLKNPGVQ
ncbi:MDS1 and EVI1 complex locus protein EVI1-A-like [Copidosoma floridanum]|uniref:MDS1 and EVI1 complex locus protein EVI1-A-like n=1 Tax=Copidosoma floridanum TaxID=29053 RepID=UPI000C6F9602|nr:MDS1 and EVI1 complex locus protein EVI1-A-like [Copidosoma floridanum]